MKKNYLCLLMLLFFSGMIQAQVPTFTQVAPICSGDVLAPLPILSNNNVLGVWTPPIVNTATTTYTFTPENPFLAQTTTMTIVVNVKPLVELIVFPEVVCAGTTTTVTAKASNFSPNINYVSTSGNVTAPSNQAAFGAVITAPITAMLVNSPNNGCSVAGVSPYVLGQFAGKIVLIQRGVCNFTEKVKNAQVAGAIAVVIYNNVPTIPMTIVGSDSSIIIPVIAITKEAGEAIIASLTNNEISFNISSPTLTYLWSNGATTRTIITPILNANTSYTVTVTNPNGNCSTLNSPIAITVTPAPLVTGVATQTLTPTSTLANIVVNPTTVVWYANQANALAGTSPLLNTQVVTNATTYYAVSTVGECKSAPFEVKVNTLLNSTDFDVNTSMKVYPNPFSDVISIFINSNASIEIFDVVGKSIQSQTIKNGLSQVDLSNLASGIYMMKVTNENNQTKTVRIVKN